MKEQVLALLKEDARLTVKELAVMLRCAESEVRAAILELENGVILKYTVLLDEERAGVEQVEALIEVKVNPQASKGFDEIAEEIAAYENVTNVYLMSGAYDLAVLVKGATLRETAMFVSEKLATMNVVSTATHFILKKYKIEGVRCGSFESKRLVVSP